jgi:hypothetical protein
MNREEIIQFIEANQIDKNSSVIFTIIENGQEIVYKGRIEFNFNGTPAITDDRIGIRIQMIKDASDMPYVGGVLFENLINVRTND